MPGPSGGEEALIVRVGLYEGEGELVGHFIGGAGDARPHGAADPVDTWLAQRPRVVERVDQTMHDFRASSTVDLAMLTVASRQFRVLVES